jgi:hypothetical protein
MGACAHVGAAITRTAATATLFKRCFMPVSSMAVLGWAIRCTVRSLLRCMIAGRRHPRAGFSPLEARLTRDSSHRLRLRWCGTALDAGQLLAVELVRRRVARALRPMVVHRHTLMPLWCHRGGGRGDAGCGWSRRGLRPRRCSDHKGRSDRDAIQENLHVTVLCGSSGVDDTLQPFALAEGGPCGPRAKNNRIVASFLRARNSRSHIRPRQ